MNFTVAIDGPAAAGKGTIARAVSAEFGFQHLDTGLLYRAVGRRVLDGVPAVIAASTLRIRDIARPDLRTPEVSEAASRAGAIGDVRKALIDFQRDFARREGGAVLDGRDIGTVICPDANVKLFVTASPVARANRRWRELTEAGHEVTEAKVLEDVQARDKLDAYRDVAPMVAASDAVTLDTTDMDIEAAVATAISKVQKTMESGF